MHKLLFFLDQPQDLDLLLPFMKHIQSTNSFLFEVWMTTHALKRSPRILTRLKQLAISPRRVWRKALEWGSTFGLSRFDALLTASESNLKAHRTAHALTQQANRAGLATFTLQHGHENVGISYFDIVNPAGRVDFASKEIWVWGEKYLESNSLQTAVKERCRIVGLPKRYEDDTPSFLNLRQYKHVISIFENLHWHRYSKAYRDSFIENLKKQILAHPQILFLIKPHHDERWLARQGVFSSSPPNVVFADPRDSRWQPFTAPALIKISDLVITTPSTVAVDAVMLEKPVCVVANDLETQAYSPLQMLNSAVDWDQAIDLLETGQGYSDLKAKGVQFRNKWIASVDAFDKMKMRLAEVLENAKLKK